MSASSVATQSSFAAPPTGAAASENVNPTPGSAREIMNNPTPSFGSVPGVAAAQSWQIPGGPMPLWTPPETPMNSGVGSGYVGAGRHSASSSVSGVAGALLPSVEEDEGAGGEGRKREADLEGEEQGGRKRRRGEMGGVSEESSAAE